MKKLLFTIGMLVLVAGLNAQNTGRDGRSSSGRTTNNETEKKKTETRSSSDTRSKDADVRKSQPEQRRETQRQPEQRRESTSQPQHKSEPVYNESRNRERPAPKTTTSGRTVESRNQGNTQKSSNNSNVEQHRSTNGQQRTYPSGNQDRNQSHVRTSQSERPTGDRQVNTTTRPSGNNDRRSTQQSREYVPRTEPVYVQKRQAYRTPERQRSVRVVTRPSNYDYHPIEYRRTYYPYSEPRRVEIIWDFRMYNEYRYMYPAYDYWYYPYGYRIHTISAYDVDRYVGEIARVYGRVYEVWYERTTDEFYLYFGGPYSFQDFTVILSGRDARRFSRNPERYFTNRNITVTGLISMWDDRPEMVIKKRSQVEVYF